MQTLRVRHRFRIIHNKKNCIHVIFTMLKSISPKDLCTVALHHTFRFILCFQGKEFVRRASMKLLCPTYPVHQEYMRSRKDLPGDQGWRAQPPLCCHISLGKGPWGWHSSLSELVSPWTVHLKSHKQTCWNFTPFVYLGPSSSVFQKLRKMMTFISVIQTSLTYNHGESQSKGPHCPCQPLGWIVDHLSITQDIASSHPSSCRAEEYIQPMRKKH